MTYRTKLFAMLLALVAATGGLLTWANYVKANGLLQQEVHRKARSIASTTATLLDPDVIKPYGAGATRRAQNTPSFAPCCAQCATPIDARMYG